MNAPMAGPEGRITITLSRTQTGACHPDITSSRPFALPRVFIGKHPNDVADLVGVVFRLCGCAQMGASLAAIEAASGTPASRGAHAHRTAAILAEMGREIALVVLAAPNGAVPRGSVKAVAGLARAAETIDAESWRPGATAEIRREALRDSAAAWERWLTDAVFGCRPEEWLSFSSADFAHWCASAVTAAAHEAGRLAEIDDRPWHNASPGPLRVDDILPELAVPCSASDSVLVLAPETDQGPRETGPFQAAGDHPLVRSLSAKRGPGPLARRAARLVALAHIPGQLAALCSDATPAPDTIRADAGAAAIVQTARGLLVHGLALDGTGAVAGYRIIAPTEWNFHPRGVVARALSKLPGDGDWRAAADAIIRTVDPCVAAEVRVC